MFITVYFTVFLHCFKLFKIKKILIKLTLQKNTLNSIKKNSDKD